MSLIWIALSMACLMYQTADQYLIKARPFSTVRLPCELTFIEGTDQLEFTWSNSHVANFFFNYIKNQQQGMDNKSKQPKTMFTFRNKEVVQEGDTYKYEGRIKLNRSEFGDGVMTLLLENVRYDDERLYRCEARSPHGMGEREMTLLLEDEEEPPVQLETVGKEFTAKCVSTGWYKNPIVTWFDGTNNVTNMAMKKILESRPDGTHRIVSILHVPGFVHGTYRCLIGEAERIQRHRHIVSKLSELFQNPTASWQKVHSTAPDSVVDTDYDLYLY